jgi:mRNA-degrading endonuclease HigB of HigAB toxin-antitoxin module
MAEVKGLFARASVINRERVVFSARIVFIKFVGTHPEYDRIDPATVSRF